MVIIRLIIPLSLWTSRLRQRQRYLTFNYIVMSYIVFCDLRMGPGHFIWQYWGPVLVIFFKLWVGHHTNYCTIPRNYINVYLLAVMNLMYCEFWMSIFRESRTYCYYNHSSMDTVGIPTLQSVVFTIRVTASPSGSLTTWSKVSCCSVPWKCSAVSVYRAAAYAFGFMAVLQHVVWHGAT